MAYTFDGVTKIISFDASTTAFDVRDLWSRYLDWFLTSDNSKYSLAMRNVGGDPLPGSKELGLTYFMMNGWKIRPFEENQVLTVNGNLYSEDGSSPYAPVLGAFNVTILSSVSNLVDSTVQQLPEIEYASYNGGITIDTVNGTDSSEYPYGTPNHPCKTITNSYMIRLSRGFKKIYLKSDLLLSGIPDGVLTDLELIGVTGFRKHTITGDNILLTNCSASNVKVTGAAKAGTTLKLDNCEITNLENVNLVATDCFIFDGIYKNTELFNCRIEGYIQVVDYGNFSGVGIVFNGDFSTIDCISGPTTVSLDIDSGYVKLKNSVASCLLEFNLRGGEIEFDSTCIGGEYYLEGYGTLFNNSTMTEKANHLLALETIPAPIWDEAIDGTYKAKELIRLLSSIAVGKTSIVDNGDNTATVIFRNIEDTLNRVTVSVEGSERKNVVTNV